eukprot:CAMPEP_0117612408 /NCGR_PEP_ID=MMETSP0784-20121206/82934_1 /TAXON_ID=39447 /ORGANISM="" /LENGTH=650 /DNA_ID=CAMNT_0005415963 /DNA_START=36 /DNA_END=1984 /DNA_ORIENTATION=-
MGQPLEAERAAAGAGGAHGDMLEAPCSRAPPWKVCWRRATLQRRFWRTVAARCNAAALGPRKQPAAEAASPRSATMRPIPLLRAPAQPCLLARASSGDGGCCGAGSQTDTKPVDQPRRRLNAAPMVASAAKVVGFDNGGCAPPAYAGLRPRCRGAADIGGHRKDHATGEPPYAYEKGRQGPRGLRCGGMRHAGISVGSVGRQRQGGGVAGEEIANEGEETSVAAFEAVILSHVRAGQRRRASAWLNRMLERGVPLGVLASSEALRALAAGGNATKVVERALRSSRAGAFAHPAAHSAAIDSLASDGSTGAPLEASFSRVRNMKKERMTPEMVSGAALTDLHSRASNLAAAEAWADLAPSATSHGIVAKARAKIGHAREAEEWLLRTVSARLEPTVHNYVSVIHAYAQRRKAAPAEEIFEQMRVRAIEAELNAYGALLGACTRSGDVGRAEKWLAKMCEQAVEPNGVCFRAVMGACAEAGNVTRARHWFDEMVSQGVEPGRIGYNTMVDACASVGDLDQAHEWTRTMTASSLEPDQATYGAIIDGFAKKGDLVGATRSFAQMEASGIEPNAIIFNQLIDACGRARPRAPEEATSLVRRMVAQGLEPTAVTLRGLTRVLGSEGAAELLEDMSVDWQPLRHRFGASGLKLAPV